MNADVNCENCGEAQEPSRAVKNHVSPEVSILESQDGYVLQVEMPGVNKNGLEITVQGNELTLVGRRDAEELEAELLRRESTHEDYRRVFELDPVIDAGKIEAKMDQGVLTLRLPKSERDRPRKITVNG